MTMRHVPVQWNRTKLLYDAVLLVAVVTYVWVFIRVAPHYADTTRPVDDAILRMRAFGTCAFLMLTVILCIGPLARLDRRFLPLLYNRRHFGVLTCLVAVTHAAYVLSWYYAFSPTPPLEGLLRANASYGQVLGFPFETLGIFALICLVILAATSHDFWLAFLSAPVWKSLHLLIYPAYAAIVGHVVLGYLQDAKNPTFALIAGSGALLVAGLHLAARRSGHPRTTEPAADIEPGWVPAGLAASIPDGRARRIDLGHDERVAVFRIGNRLAAVSNACAHQNGPLGEGRVLDGCITCPWHGFQYRPEDGCSPPPFTEKVPTYRLKVANGMVYVHRTANPLGTPQPLVPLSGSDEEARS